MTEGRIEQTSINEYQRVLDKLVLPAIGDLRLREATTGRLDRLLLKLREKSVNRQRKAKVRWSECGALVRCSPEVCLSVADV